jgi:hypothetical protein
VARSAVWAGLLLIAVVATVFALRPVCVPLSPDQLADFTTPIESRTDHDVYLQVFQRIDGRWHQCKTWLSRQLSF